MECSESDCSRKAKWRGLCQRHYLADQYRDTPHPPPAVILERLQPKIEMGTVVPDGLEDVCWLWQGAKHTRSGHGMFGYNALGRNWTFYVHRWLYELLVGPVPEGLVLDHVCEIANCCNPAHIDAVTDEINIKRGSSPAAKKARQTHCLRGHPLSGANLYVDARGYRSCRTCFGVKQPSKGLSHYVTYEKTKPRSARDAT